MILGVLLGMFAILRGTKIWIPHEENDWFAVWFNDTGIQLLGLTFVVASLVALRRPRTAGQAFLLSAPITTFCVATAAHTWGIDDFPTSRTLLVAALLGVIFFIPFIASLKLIRDRRHITYLAVSAVLLIYPTWVMAQKAHLLIELLVYFSVPCLAFGWFWLRISRRPRSS
jgi:hypothetical protein